jgi:ribose 1,5-bisphosphokinase PhnN
MFFHSWAGIGHVMLSSVIVFALIVLTRFFRSRSRRGDDEIRAAVRTAGLRSLADAQVLVLENDGEWSVFAQRVGPRRLP